jgi:hypothetical protein
MVHFMSSTYFLYDKVVFEEKEMSCSEIHIKWKLYGLIRTQIRPTALSVSVAGARKCKCNPCQFFNYSYIAEKYENIDK